MAVEHLPWLSGCECAGRLLLIPVGFLPVTLIGASCFGADLRLMALGVLVPALLAVAALVGCRPWGRRLLVQGIVAGVAATALYDLFRFSFLWVGLMDSDPIPHIGSGLGLHPAWLFGYLWRFLLNGGGLAVAFTALDLRGARRGAVYGAFVGAGLLVTLLVSPHGQEVLFPLTPAAITMAVGGHLIYGAVLGAVRQRAHDRAATAEPTLLPVPRTAALGRDLALAA